MKYATFAFMHVYYCSIIKFFKPYVTHTVYRPTVKCKLMFYWPLETFIKLRLPEPKFLYDGPLTATNLEHVDISYSRTRSTATSMLPTYLRSVSSIFTRQRGNVHIPHETMRNWQSGLSLDSSLVDCRSFGRKSWQGHDALGKLWTKNKVGHRGYVRALIWVTIAWHKLCERIG